MAYWDSNSRGWILRLTINEKSQSIANNRTVISVSYVLHPPDQWNWFWAMAEGYLYINGAYRWERWKGMGDMRTTPGEPTHLWSGDITIPHNEDGQKTVSFEGTFRTSYLHAQLGWVSNDHHIKNSFKLTRINRGIWVKHNGTWKRAIPYVKHDKKWKVALPYVKSGGKWRIGGS